MSMQSSSNQIGIHFPNREKRLQFRPIEVSESENLFLDHIHREDKNVEDVQMADHLRPIEELLQIPTIGIEDAIVVPTVLTNEFELKIKLLDFIRAAETWLENEPINKPQVSSSGGSSIQNDAITALTNQEAPIQLMQTQIGQLEETFQERPLGVLPSDTETYPREERKASTPLVPPLETSPLSSPRPKKNLEPNPHQPLIPYPSRLQNDKFQTLENPTGRADHFVYRIDIFDSLCDKFSIENNSLSSNPTPSSDSVVESLSPLPTSCGDSDSLVEKTDTLLSYFNDSLPEYETFCFDIEEKSSGNTTSLSDHSLSDYEAFCFDVDHIKEKSSGSTTSHSHLSLLEYESFHFDISIDQLPPADRSDSHHEEFADEHAHIISPPEYDHFYFDLEDDPVELTRLFKENISKTSPKNLTRHELNDLRLLLYNNP
ncbi:hypothetical protein Tco_1348691 [Tanacetum coccineum]